jgi:hypothetical protein
MKNKRMPRNKTALRTWVVSKSESVDGCSDNEADGNVEVANDYFDAGKNYVISLESKRVVCVCRDGKR